MGNTIIAHGKPSRAKFESPDYPGPTKANWLPWTAKKLEERGEDVAIPAFPIPYEPDYETWVPVLERERIDKETTLIGHSFGAGMILRWMSEHNKAAVKRMVLVAPWLDPERKYGDLSDFQIDKQLRERCLAGMALFYSSLDDEGVQVSVERITTELPGLRVRDIPDYGHFLLGNTMQNGEFPELLEELR